MVMRNRLNSARGFGRAKMFVSLLTFNFSMAALGCSASQPTMVEATAKALTADEVIARCAETYAAATTARANGNLLDRRRGSGGTSPFTWEYSRPGMMRLRVGERVAVVRDGRWYHYDSEGDAYREHPGLGGDPIKTAAYFLSDGAPMPAVSLPEDGRAALEAGGAAHWRIAGVRWVGDRPCYALRQPFASRGGSSLAMTLWIDQDTFLLRGWVIGPPDAEGDEDAVICCEYAAVELNTPIAANRFAVGPREVRTVARVTRR